MGAVLRISVRWAVMCRVAALCVGLPLVATLVLVTSSAVAQTPAWEPRANCTVSARGAGGLVPVAQQALERVHADHRVTQTINASADPANYHGQDQVVGGHAYTAAVDLSVNCLRDDDIKQLLSALADAGFAAWYRSGGRDGWKGKAHVHAVYAVEPLKPQLRGQVKSWLAGRTGLKGDAVYKYWQPAEAQRQAVERSYQASKPAQ